MQCFFPEGSKFLPRRHAFLSLWSHSQSFLSWQIRSWAFILPLLYPKWWHSGRGWHLSVCQSERTHSEIRPWTLKTSKVGSTCEKTSSPLSYRFSPHLYCVIADGEISIKKHSVSVSSEVEAAGSAVISGIGSSWSWARIVLNPV